MKLSFYAGAITNEYEMHHECPKLTNVCLTNGVNCQLESSIYMLQSIKIDNEEFNLFYDSGCGDLVSRKQVITRLENMGRANQEMKGQIILTGVGDHKTKCERGIYKVKIPMYDGQEVNISGLCLDKVTPEFPIYRMEEDEKDIQREYQMKGLSPKGLPKLPNKVGGNTDLMLGIKYLKYFSKLKQFPKLRNAGFPL